MQSTPSNSQYENPKTDISTMTVAIILATYNGQVWIHEQIQSVIAQTHSCWRLFIRDDLSTDCTQGLAQSYSLADSRITVLPPPLVRSGSAAANFLATLMLLQPQNYDFIAFCDQDDIWVPDKLTRAVATMKEASADAYSCDLIAFNNEKKTAQYIAKNPQQSIQDYLFQGASAGCTYVLSRKAVELVCQKLSQSQSMNLADKSHDWLVYAICRSHGLTWKHDASAQVFYRQHSSNVYGAMQQWTGALKKLRLMRSGWYRRHILWNAGFLQRSEQDERVLVRLLRFQLADRCWLALRAARFRRDPAQALILASIILLGWL